MRFTYLYQGTAENLLRHKFPDRSILALTYDRAVVLPQVLATIFNDKVSWARGRNLLLQTARVIAPADYYVLCDDDVRFVSGSYMEFEAALTTSRPAIGFPTTEKALLSGTFVPSMDVQRAIAIDEQIYAVHHSLLGVGGIAPLETGLDDLSWYGSSFIFEYLCASIYGPQSHQYNRIIVANDGHVWQSGDNAYSRSRGDFFATRQAVRNYFHRRDGGFDHTLVEQLLAGYSLDSILAVRRDRMKLVDDMRAL